MPTNNEQPPVTDGDLQEKLQEATVLLEDLGNYEEAAGAIDERFERKNEHRNLTLEDMPYGEELIRTREATEAVESAIEQLQQVEAGKFSGAQAREVFDQAAEALEEARATLEDCKELPGDELGDDD